jgi:hypothetical protein
MLASLPSQHLDSDSHPLVNPQQFPPLRNRSKSASEREILRNRALVACPESLKLVALRPSPHGSHEKVEAQP